MLLSKRKIRRVGAASVDIDLSPAGGRYDINVIREISGQQTVILIQSIAGNIEGMRYQIEGPAGAYHDYQLVFDPATREARLLVDGVERLSHYRGHREYLQRFGLMITTAHYKSERAEALFKQVSFEINPSP